MLDAIIVALMHKISKRQELTEATRSHLSTRNRKHVLQPVGFLSGLCITDRTYMQVIETRRDSHLERVAAIRQNAASKC